VRRDTGEKWSVALAALEATARETLDRMQDEMLADAIEAQNARIVDIQTVADAPDATLQGFARLPFSLLTAEAEVELARNAVSVRCIQRADGSVPLSEDEPDLYGIVARSY
jgi:prolyl-tRNA synthetase